MGEVVRGVIRGVIAVVFSVEEVVLVGIVEESLESLVVTACLVVMGVVVLALRAGRGLEAAPAEAARSLPGRSLVAASGVAAAAVGEATRDDAADLARARVGPEAACGAAECDESAGAAAAAPPRVFPNLAESEEWNAPEDLPWLLTWNPGAGAVPAPLGLGRRGL